MLIAYIPITTKNKDIFTINNDTLGTFILSIYPINSYRYKLYLSHYESGIIGKDLKTDNLTVSQIASFISEYKSYIKEMEVDDNFRSPTITTPLSDFYKLYQSII